MKINKLIDHTLLKADATIEQIEALCKEAIQYDFMSVCVNPCFVNDVKKFLKGSNVKVCTVIGFPLGASTTDTKCFETSNAVENGADEIDMVINVSKAKNHDFDSIAYEINKVKLACKGKLLKVILETCLLTDDEIVESCKAAVKAGADFVKTSTGFSKGGATVHHVKLMKETVGEYVGVKASGGIHTLSETMDMINAGANRIGASAGVKIISEIKK